MAQSVQFQMCCNQHPQLVLEDAFVKTKTHIMWWLVMWISPAAGIYLLLYLLLRLEFWKGGILRTKLSYILYSVQSLNHLTLFPLGILLENHQTSANW